MPSYSVSGRVVGSDGTPVVAATVTIHQVVALTGDPPQRGNGTSTDPRGYYSISWDESVPPNGSYDLFVRAQTSADKVESPLLGDFGDSITVDLVLGTGPYEGLTEWQRIEAKLAPLLGDTAPQDVPADRLEWLSQRADVFPLHLAAYVQAHRLAYGRTIGPQRFYAFLRGGLPADLRSLVRAGAAAWSGALRDAWARRVVPLPGDGSEAAKDQEITDTLAAMRELVVDAAVTPPSTGVNQRAVFDTAGLSVAKQRTFARLWAEHSGPIEQFWAAVSSSELSAEVPLLKFTVQAATLVGGHTQTLAALQAERGRHSITNLADTAAWSIADWDAMLTSHDITPPAHIPGTDPTKARQTYARALYCALEHAHSSASLAASLSRDSQAAIPGTTFVDTFLAANPEFDIVESTLAHYLDGAQAPWAGIDPADQAQARANVERVQRVYRLTPPIGRYATARVLLEQGVESATQVVGKTRNEFVQQFGPLLPGEHHEPNALAGAVWDNAAKVHALVIGLTSQLALAKSQADFVPIAFGGSRQFAQATNGLAQLSTILGNLDYCACTHCRSVFSPAAYLADLLAFARERPAKQGGTALDLLLARRPDIIHILLDCANTNTVLPYIDLVNELLEDFVNGGLGNSSKQTTWTAAELRLHPEHLDAAVYASTALTQTLHPWTLPFSLSTLEGQTYLRHLGVPRHELMRRVEALAPSNDEVDARAGDRLGLDLTNFRIIAGLHSVGDGRKCWGFASGAGTDGWVDVLRGTGNDGDVGELLSRARLELDELRELLTLRFINPDGNIVLQWMDTCELDDASIAFLEADGLDRIHRLLRLQRATKIPADMLDVLLCDALGGTLNRASLRRLADIVELRERLHIDWDELATFWAAVIDARDGETRRSLYTRRFLAKDLGPVDPNFVPADDGTHLFGEGNPPTAITAVQLPRVLAGLGISERDFQRLKQSSLASDAFSFTNLTALFRSATLARVLRLSIGELVRLTALTGLDPFADPAATAAFIDQVEAVRMSDFSLDELDWLLRHEALDAAPLDDETTARDLAQLCQGLHAIDDESMQLVDPDGQALAAYIELVFAEVDVPTVHALVERTIPEQADRDAVIDHAFPSIVDVSKAKEVLSDISNEDWAEIADRRAWLLGTLVGHVRRRAFVIDTITTRFEIPATVAEALLDGELTDPSSGAALLEVYRRPFATREQLAKGLMATVFPIHFAGWTRFAKAALVCKRFDLRPDEIAWYSGRSGWLEIDTLPLTEDAADTPFDDWERLRQALELRELWGRGDTVPAQLAGATKLADAIQLLADAAGWDDVPGLLALATALGYQDADAPAFAQEVIPARLNQLVETAARLGVGLDVLRDWATPTPTAQIATAIKSATRAKYGEDRWPEVAKPLRDAIRERQRDALVDAAIAITPAFRTVNDVFEHLLIDVEMSACMMTSRIKQAIASVQIFIHRVLLHLESANVILDSEAIARWDWMKNYRVWEANRKVFLYPENWIEPQLRKDKTPQFAELEADLMQGVLDPPRVEKALAAYLESLARVGNLELTGVYEHPGTGELWLLGRTHASPHEFFVRRRRPAKLWDAWEVVPVGIESDAATIVFHHGRLHVLWATRQDVRGPNDTIAYRFQLHHVERGPDGWGKPSVSRGSSRVSLLEPHEFRLHALVAGLEILATVLWKSPDSEGGWVGIAASFALDLIEGRARTRTTWMDDFIYEDDDELEDVSLTLLSDRQLIALQPHHYEFDGQRFVMEIYGDTDGQGDPSVMFCQGDATFPLFEHPSAGYKPAFVHHTDLWTPHGDATLKPVLYDDRRRKYLLEPDIAWVFNDPNPAQIGHVVVGQFVACPPPVPMPKSPPPKRRGVRRVLDGLSVRRPWAKGTPGQQPAFDAVAPAVIAKKKPLGQGMMFDKMKAMALASLDLAPDDDDPGGDGNGYMLRMTALYHPFVRDLQVALASGGIAGLYAPPTNNQLFRQRKVLNPLEAMGLKDVVHGPEPKENYDFLFDSPYAVYNWELFYHVPMLLAAKLATEQRWDEAQRWHHLIFNPIEPVDLPSETAASKFWRIKPFFEQAAKLAKDQFEVMLGIGVTKAEQQAAIADFSKQVAAWEANPFDPHAVARVRPGVYQRALLRGYFDNLIAWADHLFRQDTIESITEATVLYIVVAQLLGPRPQAVPGPEVAPKSFAQLVAAGLDAFSNAMIQLESFVHLPAQDVVKQGCGGGSGPLEPWTRVPVISRTWYFCYPPNPELLAYWDIIADRLFKIRHCQTIDGVERQLPLFEPPIDPGLLVQATAAGLDLRTVLAQLDSGLPPYRFRSVHARATGFAASLRSLGAALLSAIEKRDAEELSRIRSSQELDLLARVRDVRTKQRDEARAAIESLEAAREVTRQRQLHYYNLIRDDLLTEEQQQFDAGEKAQRKRLSAQGLQLISSTTSAAPQVSVSLPPSVSVSLGGLQISNILNALSAGFNYQATEQDYKAGRAGLNASFARRKQDWLLQAQQAGLESKRIDRDLIAAKIRLAIAERELSNHAVQVEHAQEIDAYLRTKFSRQELYDWMIRELSTLYFQTYRLAFDLARRAERAYRHELAIDADDAPIIQFGYWDSLHKGLLAGERLGHDLERLDLAYMDRDIREFELRKSVSLAELDPAQLQALRETGSCTFELPEVIYDIDHPGHYLRRIRAVRLTIPAVVGPHVSLGASLQLVTHKTRRERIGTYAEQPVGSDARFDYGTGGGQMIATSTAVNDGGLFNLDFRDERYLPFEYAGAISTWKLDLPAQVRQFDYRTIEDVVIHVDYTARNGGRSMRSDAEGSVIARLNQIHAGEPLTLLVAVHEAFPNEWQRMLEADDSGNHVLTLPLSPEHFPFFVRHRSVALTHAGFALLLEPSITGVSSFGVSLVGQQPTTFKQTGGNAFMIASFALGDIAPDTMTLTIGDAEALAQLRVDGDLDAEKLVGMILLIRYTLGS